MSFVFDADTEIEILRCLPANPAKAANPQPTTRLPLPGVSAEFAARLCAEDWEDIAAGDISVELVRAFEQVFPNKVNGLP